MKSVPTQTSKNYHSYLIESLKDPEEAAGYLEVFLEEDCPEPELCYTVLSHILEALGETSLKPEQQAAHHQKLIQILNQPGNIAIYELSQWLETLGLKIQIQVQKPSADNTSISTEIP
ncbi:MAG: DNA-binding protein [Spirulinaceae cyanobacterium]